MRTPGGTRRAVGTETCRSLRLILPETEIRPTAVTSWPPLARIRFWTTQMSLSSCLLQVLYQPSFGAPAACAGASAGACAAAFCAKEETGAEAPNTTARTDSAARIFFSDLNII